MRFCHIKLISCQESRQLSSDCKIFVTDCKILFNVPSVPLIQIFIQRFNFGDLSQLHVGENLGNQVHILAIGLCFIYISHVYC